MKIKLRILFGFDEYNERQEEIFPETCELLDSLSTKGIIPRKGDFFQFAGEDIDDYDEQFKMNEGFFMFDGFIIDKVSYYSWEGIIHIKLSTGENF